VAGFLLTRTRLVGGTLRALRLTRRLIPVQGSATAYGFTDRSGRRGDRYTVTTVRRDGGRRDAPTVLVTG
jgi:hypothetical protein